MCDMVVSESHTGPAPGFYHTTHTLPRSLSLSLSVSPSFSLSLSVSLSLFLSSLRLTVRAHTHHCTEPAHCPLICTTHTCSVCTVSHRSALLYRAPRRTLRLGRHVVRSELVLDQRPRARSSRGCPREDSYSCVCEFSSRQSRCDMEHMCV